MVDARQDPLCILVTGAGAPGVRGTVYSLRQNPDRRPLRLVGVDVNPDVAGRYLVDAFHRIVAPEDPGYLRQLSEICGGEGVRIIIPQTTREVSALARHKSALLAAGFRVMVADEAAIVVANNKWRLLEAFRNLGLPSPACKLARSEAELLQQAEQLGYPTSPFVVKPACSNGMRGVRVVRESAWNVARFLNEKPSGLEISLAALIRILRNGAAWPELLVMEYLPGEEYSVDVFLGERSQVAIPRLRKATRSGITFEAVIELRPDLIGYSLRAARHLGLRYASGFQFKRDAEGLPRILECNPRVQGTMVASIFGGVNVIWLGVKELLGESPCCLPETLREAKFYRFWGGVGVNGLQFHEI